METWRMRVLAYLLTGLLLAVGVPVLQTITQNTVGIALGVTLVAAGLCALFDGILRGAVKHAGSEAREKALAQARVELEPTIREQVRQEVKADLQGQLQSEIQMQGPGWDFQSIEHAPKKLADLVGRGKALHDVCIVAYTAKVSYAALEPLAENECRTERLRILVRQMSGIGSKPAGRDRVKTGQVRWAAAS